MRGTGLGGKRLEALTAQSGLLSVLNKVLLLMAVIFTIEYIIMMTLPSLHVSSGWKNVLDGLFLVVLLSPPVYTLFALRNVVEEKDADLKVYQSLVERTLQGIMITDSKMNIIYVNHGFTRTTGYSRDEVVGQSPRILQSGLQDADFYRKMWGEIRETGQWQGEICDRRKDGTVYTEHLNISAIYSRFGTVKYYVGIFTDITGHVVMERELRNYTDELLVLTHTDYLTQIPNRWAFEKTLESEWARHERTKTPLAVMMLDIDDFKAYNDCYGHMAGDQILKSVAQTIYHELNRAGDTVARIGGEEFAVILSNTTADGGRVVAERLRTSVEQRQIEHRGTSSRGGYLTISVGVAHVVPTNEGLPAYLLNLADEALYEAKRYGKNQTVVRACEYEARTGLCAE